jgi:hypothetical protein
MNEENKTIEETYNLQLLGFARPCPLSVEEDPDMQEYDNEGDILIIEDANGK